jgi:pantetheine-phosphate adenylyltransferase
MKIAVFPGTFDPITNGHVDIIEKALPIFDKIIIAIGVNTSKKTLFDLDKRLGWINEVFKDSPAIETGTYEGLTVEYCKKENAGFILRGLRSSMDFVYEEHIAQVNRKLNENVDTIFVLSSQENSHISSTIVRDIITYGGDYSQFVPKAVKA